MAEVAAASAAPAAPASAPAPAAAAAPAEVVESKTAAPEGAPAADPSDAPAPKMFKVKIDGQELEVSEEDLLRGYQTRQAADKRFKEAAETKKAAEARGTEVEAVLQMIFTDPKGFADRVKALGGDPNKLAEEILLPAIHAEMDAEAEQAMSPEQLKAKHNEKRIAEYERKDAEAKKAAEDAEKQKVEATNAAQVQKYQEEFSATILGALEETALPRNEHTAIDLAELLAESIERGLSVDAKTLARDLESRTWEKLNILAKQSAAAKGKADFIDEDVRKMIRQEALTDPEIREAIRKQAIEEFKQNNPMTASKPVTGKSSGRVASKESKPRTMGAVMRELQLRRL